MAARRDTIRLLGQIRITIDDTVTAALEDLAYAWGRAWTIAATEWEAAALALAVAREDGKWPTRAQIRREHQAQRALTVTRALLDDLGQNAGIRVIQAAGTALDVALTSRPDLIATQLPTAARAELAASFNVVNARQIDAIVRRTTDIITAQTRPLSADATSAMYDELVRGVLLGDNPRTAASRMVSAVQGRFEGGLTRANVIARTEILDAHRNAAMAWDQANTAVVGGWQWVADLGPRCCPSCWGQHGSIHPIDEAGPIDHQQGRCARLTITRPWSELGISIKEPPSLVPDAQARFAALPEADQLAIMGPQRLELLQSGQVSWGDLSQRRSTDGWRDSMAPTPVRTLTRIAGSPADA